MIHPSSDRQSLIVATAFASSSFHSVFSMLSGFSSNRAFTIPCCTNRSLTLLCQRPKFLVPSNLIISNFADKIPDIVTGALIPIVVAEAPIDATPMKKAHEEQTQSKSTEKGHGDFNVVWR